MTHSTKSVVEIKEAISKHAENVNESISNTVKDLGVLTKDLVQKESAVIQAFKEQAAQDVKDVQDSYARKEEKMHKLFASTKNSDENDVHDISRQYEAILRENVAKLKEIVKEDFQTSSQNAQNLTEETKVKIHSIILGAFSNRDPKEDFANTAGTIFENINSKIRDDLHQKGHSAKRTASNLAPDLSNVFIHHKTKPPEEIEAERLLQSLVEEQLLELQGQAQKDFKDIDSRISSVVNDTKRKVNQAIQTVTTKELPKVGSLEAAETRSLPNLPRASTVERNVGNLLSKAGADFQQVKDSMLNDVDRRKQRINDNVKYCAEKLLALTNMAEAVKINRLQVPEIIKHGSQAILDCDFTMDENDSDLVVKWYLNKSLVYQWIPSTKKRPQSLGVLKNRVNLEYQASVDANSIHRALHILKTGPDLTGNYTCSVSTLESEDFKTKGMVVFVTEKFFELKRLKANEGSIRVECRADGIFPKPVMSLHSQQREIPPAVVQSRMVDQLYEISAQVTLPELDKPEEFSCKLHIPQANYATRRETVFYPGVASSAATNKWLTIFSSLISCYIGLRYFGVH